MEFCAVLSNALCVCVCVCERERETGLHHSGVSCLNAACVQIHTSIITVFVTRLCSSFGLELMVKLTTLLTVFIFTLKDEAHDYGKGCYISDARLWCSDNHTGSVGQSEQTALVGRRCFVENDTFETLKNNVFFNIKACQHIVIYCYTKYTK